MKLLVTVDGSEVSLRAVEQAAKVASEWRSGAEVHLLHVQHSLPGSVGMFVSGEDLRSYHREEGFKILAPARAILDKAGVAHTPHIGVGRAAEMIDRFARDLGIHLIVMGTRGLGNVADIVLGSTSEDVLKTANVPVLLVK